MFRRVSGSDTTYGFSTPDAQDAHDFGSKEKAQAYLQGIPAKRGVICELTDEGYWPEQL